VPGYGVACHAAANIHRAAANIVTTLARPGET